MSFGTFILNRQHRTQIAAHETIDEAIAEVADVAFLNGWDVVAIERDTANNAADVATSKGCMMNLYAIEAI